MKTTLSIWLDGFEPNWKSYIIGGCNRADYNLVTFALYSRLSVVLKDSKILNLYHLVYYEKYDLIHCTHPYVELWFIALCLLESSADNLCKQFGPISDRTKSLA